MAAPGYRPLLFLALFLAAAAAGADSARAPIYADEQPDAGLPVNRERLYDFYAKQAALTGDLLPPFPGLDGGSHGHQGNQNDDETWKDGRWAAGVSKELLSGTLQLPGLLATKAVWVKSGDRCAAFDPAALRFVAEWRGDLVRLGDRRRGFIEMPRPGGEPRILASASRPGGVYRGFYRHGGRVIFSYARDGKEWLATLEDGERPRAALEHLARGGQARWPTWITTRGRLGKGPGHRVDTVAVPFANPYGTLFFISGMDFLPDGTAVLATMPGEVWLVRGLEGNLETVRWKRFATGLFQPLGVKVVAGRIHVIGRDQITRLDDLNGDQEADFYACVTNAQLTSPHFHDYIVGLESDAQGRFLAASGNQGLIRIGPTGPAEVLATGVRNPNGLSLSPDGRFVATSLQEGNWTPSSGVAQVDLAKGDRPHFGNNGPGAGDNHPPLVRLPRGEDNSSGGVAYLGPKAWPAVAGDGNLIYLSYGMGTAWMVTRQKVGEIWQGAAMRLTGSLRSGAQHARFHPRDGALWISGLNGWQSYTPDDGCLHRVRPDPATPVLVGHEVRGNGILLRASAPLPTRAADARSAFAQCWNYAAPSPAYGSPELSLRQPGKAGHDRLAIRSATLLEGGRAVFLEIPGLPTCDQLHVRLPWRDRRDADVFLTVHALGPDYTEVAGYRPKDHAHPAATAARPGAAELRPVRWEEEVCGAESRELRVATATGLQFAQTELRARAGERLRLVFENPDTMPHNWVLADAGQADAVEKAAGRLADQPDAFARHYAPDIPEILCHTRVLLPGASTTIWFQAPAKPGRYPYLCTIPGHARIMRGTLVVE